MKKEFAIGVLLWNDKVSVTDIEMNRSNPNQLRYATKGFDCPKSECIFTANCLVFLRHFSCYLGRLTRDRTTKYLQGKKPGTYLIRDSSSIPGDFVLAVRLV